MSNPTPQIRFKEFEERFNFERLDEVADKLKSYSLSRDVETLESTGYRYIHYGDIHTKRASLIIDEQVLPSINKGDYISLQQGDLVIADASEDYQGIATPALLLNNPSHYVIAGLHTIALRVKKQHSPLYLYYLLNSPVFKRYAYKAGTGMKVFGISYPNLAKFEHLYPSKNEQEKIGLILKQLDDTIELYQQLINQRKQFKKTMLLKMFPQKGERVPKLRFKGFKADWEKILFGELFKVTSGFAFKHEDYVNNGVKIVNGEAIQHGKINTNNWNYLPQSFLIKYGDFVLKTDDIVLGLNRPITNNQLKIARVPESLNNSLLYQRAGKIIFKTENIDKEFSYQLLENEIFRFVLKEAVGSDQPFISTTKLDKWSFLYPTDLNEQQKIGDFFKELNATIGLHEKKLANYQQLKKTLLQKMFI